MELQKATIPAYYRGKTILVTGASGFIGKVLIWKLLNNCSDLDTLFVLVRPKHGKDVQLRVAELLQAPIFNNFKKENPEILSKVHGVAGDIAEPRLGLCDGDERKLADSVQVVFHIAAILKFDASLKDAVNLNVEGTQRLLELATRMTKLEAFIHTSTAYCHCDIPEMEERIYPASETPEQIVKLVHWMNPEALDSISDKLIKPHPNTYTYSKRLAENVVAAYFPQLPIAIARPSVVISSHLEPIPGWVDNMNGLTGFMIAAAKGVLRVIWCDKDRHIDVVPVDVVCNGLIAVAWEIGKDADRAKEMPVYNLTQQEMEPITFDEIMRVAKSIREAYPFSLMLWYPDVVLLRNFYLYMTLAIFLHWIPAYLVDALLFALGYKMFMIRAQRKIHHGLKVFHYFASREWKFAKNNIVQLRGRMSPEDRQAFKLTNDGIDREAFLRNSAAVARHYMMKEDPASIPMAKRRLKMLYYLHLFVKFMFWFFVTRTLLSLSSNILGIDLLF